MSDTAEPRRRTPARKKRRRAPRRLLDLVPLPGQAEGPGCKLEYARSDLFVVFDGRRIAKRGKPGTPQARTWIPIVRGYTVTGGHDELWDELYVAFDPPETR